MGFAMKGMDFEMKGRTGEMAKTVNEKNRQDRKSSDEYIALQRCYGEIGISAVAAAIRYFGDAKNMA
ncbi:MAG TPA: hypothetical protein VK430_06380 [Xanthobacteraceae bacterium]|nr:hypothetical protein [Xanthobacteraceae bacterium]